MERARGVRKSRLRRRLCFAGAAQDRRRRALLCSHRTGFPLRLPPPAPLPRARPPAPAGRPWWRGRPGAACGWGRSTRGSGPHPPDCERQRTRRTRASMCSMLRGFVLTSFAVCKLARASDALMSRRLRIPLRIRVHASSYPKPAPTPSPRARPRPRAANPCAPAPARCTYLQR